MNEKKRKNVYDEAFKRKAVELVKVPGKKQSQVERELGLYPGALTGWISAFEKNAGTAKEVREELRKQKRELDNMRM